MLQAYTIYDFYQQNNLHLEIDFIGNTRTYLLNKENN